MPLVYEDLRRLAGRAFRREQSGHTLEATAIVHEAFVRMTEGVEVSWESRGHFFGIAARLMRQVLVDHARSRGAVKRGGDRDRVTLAEADAALGPRCPDLIALDAVLENLSVVDPRKAKIVELRFFGGLKNGEIAQHLGIGEATVGREWRKAKAWLYDQLDG